jgi:hypothetical protein
MPRRNDVNSLRNTGNKNELGRLSFAYFFYMKAIHGLHPAGSMLCKLLLQFVAKHDCMDAEVRATQEQLPGEK